MKTLNRVYAFVGGLNILTREFVRALLQKPFGVELALEQIYQVGVRSLPLVILVALSSGMVMALQFGYGLEKFGGKLYVPKIVSLSIVREMGPVFACLMLAARVGAGITSELGSMKVTQQIDAIRALGTSPIKKIIMPRMLACLLTIPLLSTMAIIVGIFGGLVVGSLELGLDHHFYFQKILTTINLNDFFSGFGKTIFFAYFISVTSCYFGLNVSGGTQGVGSATTKAVVVSSISILVGDYFLTKLFFLLDQLL